MAKAMECWFCHEQLKRNGAHSGGELTCSAQYAYHQNRANEQLAEALAADAVESTAATRERVRICRFAAEHGIEIVDGPIDELPWFGKN